MTPEVLVAIRDKKLLPLAKMDRGFVSPEYPSQVVVSYFQAGVFVTISVVMGRGSCWIWFMRMRR